MTPVLPLVGVAVGTASTTVGAAGLSMLLFSTVKIEPKERVSIGAAALALLGLGTALSAVSGWQLQQARRMEA